MGRYYLFSKKVDEEQEVKILSEMRALDNVKDVEITPDFAYLKVTTKDGEYSEVMSAAVNICSRLAGVEIVFKRFAYEDL